MGRPTRPALPSPLPPQRRPFVRQTAIARTTLIWSAKTRRLAAAISGFRDPLQAYAPQTISAVVRARMQLRADANGCYTDNTSRCGRPNHPWLATCSTPYNPPPSSRDFPPRGPGKRRFGRRSRVGRSCAGPKLALSARKKKRRQHLKMRISSCSSPSR
jgi:hypothetical protein